MDARRTALVTLVGLVLLGQGPFGRADMGLREPDPDRGVDLGARMTPREIALPALGRGQSARLSLDEGHRGWVVALPEAGALLPSAAWAGGKVIVSGGFASHSVYAFDDDTGRFAWRAQAPDGGPSAAIVVGDKVLFNTESCTLFCVDAATGRQLWKRWLGDPLMSQPASDGRLVYSAHVVNGGDRSYALTAMRVGDGEVVWSKPLDADAVSAAVVAGGSVYLTSMLGTVYRFAAADGREIWSSRLEATSAPWVAVRSGELWLSRRLSGNREQQIVVSAQTGRIVRSGTVLPGAYAAQRPDSGGVAAGWGYEGSRPVLAAGRAYYAMGREVRAKDLATGREVWRRRFAEAVAERGLTPPAVVGGTLVVGSQAGDVFGVDIDTGLTTFAYRIGEPIAFQPIVAKGWVYCTTATGKVVGLQISDEQFDGWHMWGGSPTHTGPVAPTASAAAHRDRPAPSEGTLEAERDGGQRVVFPLSHTEMRASVSGFVASIDVEQTFDNPFDRPLDAEYLFPLPVDAAVDAMEIRVGDRVVRARISRRAQARQTFEQAQQRGQVAALLEWHSGELFRQAVANVPAGQSVIVRLHFASVLPYRDGAWALSLPLTAAPRYTGDGQGALAAPVSAPGDRPATDVAVTVDVEAGVSLQSVSSPSHAIEVSRPGPSRAHVTLSSSDRVPNRDFLLTLGVAADAPRAAVLATAERGDGVVSLLVHPRARTPDGEIAPREVVLVIDGSSSMRGRPLAQARATALSVLQHLRPADTFRILAFSDVVTPFDPAAVPASPDGIERARAFLEALRPAGGTEVSRALGAAWAAPADPAHLKVVALLSDGLVGHEDDVLSSLANRVASGRLYAVGLGPAPDRYLLEHLAELGRGDVLYGAPGEDPAALAARFAARIDAPVLTDVTVDWGDLPIHDALPRAIPDLHADRPLVVHARYALGDGDGDARDGTVRIRGRLGGRPWSAEVPVTLPRSSSDHRALGSVWARALVHDLETAAFLRPTAALRERIAEAGLRWGLVTRETSFVAVDTQTRVDRSEGAVRGEQAFTADVDSAGGGVGGDVFADVTISGELPAPPGDYGGDMIVERDIGAAYLLRGFRLSVEGVGGVAAALGGGERPARTLGLGGIAATLRIVGPLCADVEVLGGSALWVGHRAEMCARLGPISVLGGFGPLLAVDDEGTTIGLTGGVTVLWHVGRFTVRHELQGNALRDVTLATLLGVGLTW